MPTIPALNFFSACRRVTDCATPLASSSNLLFIIVLSDPGCDFLPGLKAIGCLAATPVRCYSAPFSSENDQAR
jgi:hypothetical protein